MVACWVSLSTKNRAPVRGKPYVVGQRSVRYVDYHRSFGCAERARGDEIPRAGVPQPGAISSIDERRDIKRA